MAGALKYVFVAVAIFCYMQFAEMARLPRETENEPAPIGNIFESLTKPEFWNSLSANASALFTQENLKEGFAKVQENLKSGIAQLNKIMEQNQQPAADTDKSEKTRK